MRSRSWAGQARQAGSGARSELAVTAMAVLAAVTHGRRAHLHVGQQAPARPLHRVVHPWRQHQHVRRWVAAVMRGAVRHDCEGAVRSLRAGRGRRRARSVTAQARTAQARSASAADDG